MSDRAVYTVFADGPGGGNPAGVVLDPAETSADALLACAQELDVPTTAFLTRTEGGPALRFFTPTAEIAMCGHATLSAVTALVDASHLTPDRSGTSLPLVTRAGRLHVCVTAGVPPTVALALSPASFRPDPELGPAELALALGLEPVSDPGGGAPGIAGAGLWHLFVCLPRLDDLARLVPDPARIAALARRLEVDTLGVTAVERHADGALGLRDLCSAIGKDEEAASGTTSGALVAWATRRGLLPSQGTLAVDVRQGVEMGRPSRVRVRRGPGPRLSVHGHAQRID